MYYINKKYTSEQNHVFVFVFFYLDQHRLVTETRILNYFKTYQIPHTCDKIQSHFQYRKTVNFFFLKFFY